MLNTSGANFSIGEKDSAQEYSREHEESLTFETQALIDLIKRSDEPDA